MTAAHGAVRTEGRHFRAMSSGAASCGRGCALVGAGGGSVGLVVEHTAAGSSHLLVVCSGPSYRLARRSPGDDRSPGAAIAWWVALACRWTWTRRAATSTRAAGGARVASGDRRPSGRRRGCAGRRGGAEGEGRSRPGSPANGPGLASTRPSSEVSTCCVEDLRELRLRKSGGRHDCHRGGLCSIWPA